MIVVSTLALLLLFLNFSRQEEKSADELYKDLLYDSVRKGALVTSAMEFRTTENSGGGYYVVQHIDKHEELLVIPRAVTIEYEKDVLSKYPQFADALPERLGSGDQRALFALFLASSAEHLYVRTLPDDCFNGVTAPQSVLRNSSRVRTTLRNTADLLRRRMTLDYAELQRVAPDAMRTVSRAAYRRAYCWFESRSFGPTPLSAGIGTMVPLGSVFNAVDGDAGVAWMFDEQRESWVFYTKRAHFVGEELKLNYGGRKPNYEVLLTYGFAFSKMRKGDRVQLEVQFRDVRPNSDDDDWVYHIDVDAATGLSMRDVRKMTHTLRYRTVNETLSVVQRACLRDADETTVKVRNNRAAGGLVGRALADYYQAQANMLERICFDAS